MPLFHSLADAICRFRRKLTKVGGNSRWTAGYEQAPISRVSGIKPYCRDGYQLNDNAMEFIFCAPLFHSVS